MPGRSTAAYASLSDLLSGLASVSGLYVPYVPRLHAVRLLGEQEALVNDRSRAFYRRRRGRTNSLVLP